jgi:hypothetical protein
MPCPYLVFHANENHYQAFGVGRQKRERLDFKFPRRTHDTDSTDARMNQSVYPC